MILNDESRALLKRMDADDAIDKAIELALEAAAKVADGYVGCEAIAEKIRALKDQK